DIASRTTDILTPKLDASSLPVGRRCPGANSPLRTRRRSSLATSSASEARPLRSDCGSILQGLARVHDALRIKRVFNALHQAQLDLAFVARQFVALQLSYAVLGADGPIERMNAIVHQLINVILTCQHFRFGFAYGPLHVVVQIAVAQMTECNVAHARKMLLQ